MREPTSERAHPSGLGIQKLYRFDNDYGASVIMFAVDPPNLPGLEHLREHYQKHPIGSYGVAQDLWELAVVHYGEGELSFELVYDTPITDDVLGYLTDDEVDEVLDRIEALPSRLEVSTERSSNGDKTREL